MISPGLAVRHSHILEFASARIPSERNTSASRQNHLFTMSDKTGRTPYAGNRQTFSHLRTARTARGHALRKGKSPGGARRDRTDDLMLAKHALSQLSYGPLRTPRTGQATMVGLGRLELPTSRLSSARSNQLSYKPEARHLG